MTRDGTKPGVAGSVIGRLRSLSRLEQATWGCWLALILAVSVMVALKPMAHSVTFWFHNSVDDWWNRRPIYSQGLQSFYYFPAFTFLFTPFHLLGAPLGDLLWRWLSFGLLTAGLARLAALIAPGEVRRMLALIVFLAIPGVAGMLRNGQATTIMTALMMHGAADIAARRWNRASLWLGLALAFKPLALVFLLLAGAVWRPLSWRLALALLIVLAVPFLDPDPGYVLAQYRDMVGQYDIAYGATVGPWSELGMMLYKLGLPLPAPAMSGLRLLAALGTLALALLAARRHPAGPAAFFVLALSICYLMLFNPANEENTFGALAGITAVWAAFAYLRGKPRPVAFALAALCFGLGADGYGTLVFHATRLWFKPMLCIVFLAFLLPALLARKEPGTGTAA